MREALSGLTLRGRAFLAAGVTAIVCAILMGQPQLTRVGILVAALPLLAAVVIGRSRYRLSLVRTVTPQLVTAGSPAKVSLALTNEGRTPSGVLLLEDQVPYVLGTRPRFAIGQRALLVLTPHGNVLWDCISLIDEATVTLIEGLGGLSAIVISHPHFYTTLVEWSRAFGDVPVHLHADDAGWVMRPDSCIRHWQGETRELLPGVTLIRGGGHFPGGTMLHWAAGAEGRGVVCSADIATVNLDRKSFTFMRSYPNHIPLSAKGVRAIGAAFPTCE